MHEEFEKRKEKYCENIHRYCDENIGEEVLSIAFMNLYPEPEKDAPPIFEEINKKDLACYTCGIINNLLEMNVLEEVNNNVPSRISNILVKIGVLNPVKVSLKPNLPERNTPHGVYRILEHSRLVDEPGFGNGKEGERIDLSIFDYLKRR